MMRRVNGKKKGKGKRPAVDNLLPGNANYVSQSENILCALDERIEDLERRGRTRKKRSNFTNKPQTRRANSLPPNNSSCPFERNRDPCPSSTNKSVHFQTCCFGNHRPNVTKQSPPPRQRKSSMKKASGDTVNKFYTDDARAYHGDGRYLYQHSPCKSANKIYNSNRSNYFAPNWSGISAVRTPYLGSFEPNSSYSVSTGMYRHKLRPTSHRYKADMMIDDLMVKYSEFKTPFKSTPLRLSSRSPYSYGIVPRKSLINASNNRSPPDNGASYMDSLPYTPKYKSFMSDGANTYSYNNDRYLPLRSKPHPAGKGFASQDPFYPDDRQPFNNSKSSVPLESIPLRSLPIRSRRSSYFEDDMKFGKTTGMTTGGQSHNMSSLYTGMTSSSNAYTSKLPTTAVKFSSIPSDALCGYKSANSFKKKSGITFDTTLSEISTDLQTMDICRKALKSMREKEFNLLNKYLYTDYRKNNYEKSCFDINENHRKDSSFKSPSTDIKARSTRPRDKPSSYSCGSSAPSGRSSSVDEYKNCHLNKFNKLDEPDDCSHFSTVRLSRNRYDDDILTKYNPQLNDAKKSTIHFPNPPSFTTSTERRLLSRYGGIQSSTNSSSLDLKPQPSAGSKTFEEDWNESKKQEDYNCKTSLTPDKVNFCSQKHSMLDRQSIFKDIELSCGLSSLACDPALPKYKTSKELSGTMGSNTSSRVPVCKDPTSSINGKNTEHSTSGLLMKYGNTDMKKESESQAISKGYGNPGMEKEHGNTLNTEMKTDFGNTDLKKSYGNNLLEREYLKLPDREVSNDYTSVCQTKTKLIDGKNGSQNDFKPKAVERSHCKQGDKYYNCLDQQMMSGTSGVKRDFDINETKTNLSTSDASNHRFLTPGHTKPLSNLSSLDMKRSCSGSCVSPIMGTGSFLAAAPNLNKGAINAYISAETDRLINLNSLISKSTNMQ